MPRVMLKDHSRGATPVRAGKAKMHRESASFGELSWSGDVEGEAGNFSFLKPLAIFSLRFIPPHFLLCPIHVLS